MTATARRPDHRNSPEPSFSGSKNPYEYGHPVVCARTGTLRRVTAATVVPHPYSTTTRPMTSHDRVVSRPSAAGTPTMDEYQKTNVHNVSITIDSWPGIPTSEMRPNAA